MRSRGKKNFIIVLALLFQLIQPENTWAFSKVLKRDEYHRFDQVLSVLHSFQERWPQLVHLEKLGQSREGRPILALRLASNGSVQKQAPEVLYVAGMHALEVTGIEVILRFIDHLLRFNHQGHVREILQNRQLWFVPAANPDGMEYFYRGRILHKNNGPDSSVDLNRNWAYKWGHDNKGSNDHHGDWGYRGPAPFSEPETQAIRDFVLRHRFVFSLSYHSYGNQYLYPWNYAPVDPEHIDFYRIYAGSMAEQAGYSHGNPKSGEIYLSNGDFDDWMYSDMEGKHRTLPMTVEIGSFFAYAPGVAVQPHFERTLYGNLLAAEIADLPERLFFEQERIEGKVLQSSQELIAMGDSK